MKKICFVALIVLLLQITLHSQNDLTFSHSGGFYENSFDLVLTCDEAYHIRYTTNGGTPTASSTMYDAPLFLDENLYSASNIYTIQTTIDELLFIPNSVQKCITIRASLFDSDDNPVGNTVTQSYFIRSLGIDTHGLSVVSIATDSTALFDYYTGIFVPGTHFNPDNPYWTGNYYETGDAWERLVNVEFYEYYDNNGINQLAGLRTHGATARRGPQKGMKLYARQDYGIKRFHHKFFEELPNNSFKHLVLKPFSDQWFSSGIQDEVCNNMAKAIGLESLASRPIALFINGEYWGIYYLRERPDSHYLEDHFGHEDTDYNVIGNWYGRTDNGDNTNFIQMMEWLDNADLSTSENYDYLCSIIDIYNFINYYCLELFIANNDWPANNMKCWQFNDGPWRWIFYDGDDCLKKMSFDVFSNATCVQNLGWPSDAQSTLMFRRLLENYDFKDAFYGRFEQLFVGAFSYENTRVYFNNAAQKVRSEVPQQALRFNKPENIGYWETDITTIDNFLMARVDDMIIKINNFESISDIYCTSTVFPNPTSGTINIHGLTQNDSEISIYDIFGRLVYTKQLDNNNDMVVTINPDIISGIYFIKAGDSTQKIIIQK